PPSSAPASSRGSMPSKQSKASDRRGAPPRTISPVPPSTISLATILESSDKSPQSSKSTESRSYRPPPPSSGPVGQTRESEQPSSFDALIPPIAPPQEDLFQPLEQRLLALKYCETASEGAEFLLDLVVQVAPAGTALIHRVVPGSGEATVTA